MHLLFVIICDPVWEKVPLRQNIIFEKCVKIAGYELRVMHSVFYIVVNYSLGPTFWCKNGCGPLFLALAVS